MATHLLLVEEVLRHNALKARQLHSIHKPSKSYIRTAALEVLAVVLPIHLRDVVGLAEDTLAFL